MSAAKLYTPELLGLAVELASYPLDEALPLAGEARSQACGSTLALALEVDGDGRIAQLGLRVRACAVGQAAAAIFARHAPGLDAADIERALGAMREWLASGHDEEGGTDGGDTAQAEPWPGLAVIEPARHYPGRHGAILLPWQAALSALSTATLPR